jgi:hypothetical protein
MKTVTYTKTLKKQLENVRKTLSELEKEDPRKSVEQFLAEIEFIRDLLNETKICWLR